MDYSKLKVTDLKAELKSRGIPQTGLKLKQNLIDRLLEADAEKEAETGAQEEPEVEEASDESAEQNQQPNDQPQVAEPEPQAPEPEEVAAEPEQDTANADAPVVPDTSEQQEPEQATTEPPPAAQEPAQKAATASPAAEQPTTSKTATEENRAAADQPSAGAVEPTPAVSASEGVDDSRKRKRRSQSPPPSPETAAQKKAKAEDGTPRIMLKDETAMEPTPVSEAGAADTKDNAPAQDVEMGDAAQPQAEESKQPQEEIADKAIAPAAEVEKETETSPPEKEETSTRREGEKDASTASKSTGNDARFKGLFPTASKEHTKMSSPPRELTNEEDEGRVVDPALHPATSSLYIRDFMRPLQPANVKNYLASLATPPKSTPDPDTVLDFFLDSIRTHCFATFPSISSASRVRSALHGAVWPQERARKPLWVDFVPEEKVKEWIQTEQDSESRGRGAPRWEVVYDKDDDNNVTTSLQEAGANRKPSTMPGDLNNMAGVPSGPRAGVGGNGDRRGPSDAPPTGPPTGPSRQHQGRGFQALDDRFHSTTAKPKLYFLPVSKEVSDQRLDKFSDLARRGPLPRPGGDEMRRYTFEDTDFFVDKGPEYGQRSARGGRGRRGGGGGMGGGFGDRSNWRGRGY